MQILVIGSGGREHAVIKALKKAGVAENDVVVVGQVEFEFKE